MANAVYNSYENYLSKDTNNPVKHTSFDLSHIYNCTTHYGALIPILVEDCVPSDHFNISNIIKVQALPMSNPIFNNIKVMTWYFFCPYQLLWRKFDKFIQGGRDGTFTATLPFLVYPDNPNSLGDYFGLPVFADETISRVSAFPFAAYQRIFRDYFLNQDDQTTSNTNAWFPDDDDEFSLRDGLNIGLGKTAEWADPSADDVDIGYGVRSNGAGFLKAHFKNQYLEDSSAPEDYTNCQIGSDYPYLGFIRFKNWKRDYFTSAMFAPQRGYEQIVPVSGVASGLVPLDFTSAVAANGLNATVGDTDTVLIGGDGSEFSNKIAGGASGTTSTAYNINLISALNKGVGNASLSINPNLTGFSITDLMLASQIQLWLERNMQVKARYNEFLRVHFGDAPFDDRLTKPAYIGGTVQSINVSEVLQTSESGTTPQGTAVGHANSLDSQFVGKYTCHEFGLIVGIMCIIPDAFYTNGVHKLWMKESRFDFYFPEFAQLPPEPIFDYEIFGSASNYSSKSIFGYSGRYDNMRHHRSISVTDLRNPSMSDFYSWNITREFGSTPTLTSNAFISTCKKMGVCTMPPSYDNDDTNVVLSTVRADHFPTNYTINPFIVQVGFKISASRPLPYRNEPQTLNLRRG